MRTAIKELPTFESEIRDELLKLLEAIAKLMHTPVKACYPLATLAETLSSLLNLRQIEGENLIDYYERFKQEEVVAKNQLGKDFLVPFVEGTREHETLTKDDDKKAMKEGSFNAFMAYLFLRRSDQPRYGPMTEGYRMSFANKKDDYPKTIHDMMDVMR